MGKNILELSRPQFLQGFELSQTDGRKAWVISKIVLFRVVLISFPVRKGFFKLFEYIFTR